MLGIISTALVPKIGFTENFNNKNNLKGEINKMAFEWKFNSRPYSDEEAKSLLKDVISPETSDWH